MEEVISGRYAKAILDLAIEGGVVNEVAEDITRMARVLRENPAFGRFLTSPLIDTEAKLKPVEKLMAGATELGRNSVLLLVRKRRITALDSILYDYRRMADEELGRATARLETAGPIDDEQVEVIKRQLERVMQKKIKMYITTNEALLAGVRARVGDRIYDGSLVNKIEEMRRILTE